MQPAGDDCTGAQLERMNWELQDGFVFFGTTSSLCECALGWRHGVYQILMNKGKFKKLKQLPVGDSSEIEMALKMINMAKL